jgi:hypothetical protein
VVIMAILTRRPKLIFKAASRRADTFTGTTQLPAASLLRTVLTQIALRPMGKIRVHHMEFATNSLATLCMVKVTVPRTERQRFIAEFGGLFKTETTEKHRVEWCFMEF